MDSLRTLDLKCPKLVFKRVLKMSSSVCSLSLYDGTNVYYFVFTMEDNLGRLRVESLTKCLCSSCSSCVKCSTCLQCSSFSPIVYLKLWFLIIKNVRLIKITRMKTIFQLSMRHRPRLCQTQPVVFRAPFVNYINVGTGRF